MLLSSLLVAASLLATAGTVSIRQSSHLLSDIHAERHIAIGAEKPSSHNAIVDLGYASYNGTVLAAGVDQFLGIRFAAPPLGDLRWRAPADPVVNRTIHPAKHFAPTCIGLFGPHLSRETNEDCLYLDVFAPSNATAGSKLPVWFFIQGGGYAGNTDRNFNFTEIIVRSNYSLVGVQINYRVGAFGFLASREIRANGDLNAGLLDQRNALEWVRKYIHLFGGNSEHVVIHGDSAGAGSVSLQLSAFGGRDDHLFVGGIMESPFWPTHRHVSQVEFQYQEFAKAVNCLGKEAVHDHGTLACLRSKTTLELQSADVAGAFPAAPGKAEWYFLPVVDDSFSQDYLYNLYAQGKTVRVPVVVGDDTDEGTEFAPNASDLRNFRTFLRANYPHLTRSDLRRIQNVYPKHAFGSFPKHAGYFPATAAAYGEATFICPGIEISNSMAMYNNPDEVWNYRYNVRDNADEEQGYGVPHVSEEPAIWGPNNSGPCGHPCNYQTYDAPIVPLLMDYWISFILSLDPNTLKEVSAPKWETWRNTDAKLQRLRIQLNYTSMEDIPDSQQRRCALWKHLANTTQQ